MYNTYIYAERCVLGAMLIESGKHSENNAYNRCYGLLDEECFSDTKTRIVYNAIEKLAKEGKPIDLLTVTHELKLSGKIDTVSAYDITMMTMDVVSSGNIEHWCLILRELAIKRLAYKLTTSGIQSDDPLDEAKRINETIQRLQTLNAVDDWESIKQVCERTQQSIVKAQEGKGFITTGVSAIDRLNGGFKPKEFIVVAARPGEGKSALMLHMALSMLKQPELDTRIGIISLEMDNVNNAKRMLSRESDIEFSNIDRGVFHGGMEEEKLAIEHLIKLGKYGDHVCMTDRASVNVHDIEAKMKKLKKRTGANVFFIDYLQLVDTEGAKNTTRAEEIGKISRGLKMAAMDMEVTVIALSQLNREAAKVKPEVHHLRESGSIEQDADIIWLLQNHKDEKENAELIGKATLHFAKWRNGQTGHELIGWHGSSMKFYDLYDAGSSPIREQFGNLKRNNYLKTVEDLPFG